MNILKSLVSLMILSVPAAALSHPGHCEDPHVHGPQHIEFTIVLAAVIAAVYLYRRSRSK